MLVYPIKDTATPIGDNIKSHKDDNDNRFDDIFDRANIECKDDEDELIIGGINKGPLTSHLILPFCTCAPAPLLPHKSFTIKIQFSTIRAGPVY